MPYHPQASFRPRSPAGDGGGWRQFPNTPTGALILAGIAVLALPLVSVISAPSFLRDPHEYLQVHTFLEFFAIAVSMLIAGIGWNAMQGKRSADLTLMATGFMAVGLLDLGHLLSYSGMPELVTAAGPEKAISFWLAARFACAATLLIVALRVLQRPADRSFRLWTAVVALGYVGAVYYAVLWHPDSLPRTFIPGQGLTTTKVVAEYAVMGIFGATAVLLWRRTTPGSTFRSPPLLAALLIFVASEAALTLYSAVHDAYNFVGHLYKVAGTYLIYRAVFVEAVQWPYVRLRRSEEKYRQLLQQAADSILLIDAEGRIIDANQRAEVMTGIERAALAGRPIRELIPSWTDPADAADPAATVIWEGQLARSGPRSIPIEVSTRRLDSGETQAIIRDISERKAGEAKLRAALAMAEQTTKAKSAFLANMSHELRTPLNAVLGFSDMIRNQVLGPIGNERYSGYATDIHQAGSHLLEIVNDVLDLARVESGRLDLAEGVVDLKSLAEECVRFAQPGAPQVTVRTLLPQGELTVRADARALRQVLLNLLSNAVKFTPAGGEVDVVSGIAADGSVEITVRDTGIGIAESDLPHVTEAFMQVEPTYARTHQGSGLGLAISKALVEMHGGTLSIASKLGKGTIVTVTLPRERLRVPTLAALA
ncbi:MASE3 domain-containing protein [Dongia sp.]|uniref:MASE3 domain-containing protein n=1 Tax=Dongia sp. TaxID=1977262 RepID=UPI003752CAE7